MDAMLTEERKQQILETLRRNGRVVAKDFAAEVGTSEDTIRRDLRELARDGLLQRVHGGALPASKAVADLKTRKSVSAAEKTVIGRAAAAMVQSGQVVFLDGGTTAGEIARQLSPSLRATIVTHSPTIVVALADHAAEVILIGGRLFRHSMVTTGAAAREEIARIRADIYFMGVTGVHPELGLTTGDAEEAAIKRAILKASGETIVLASPEKLGAASPFLVAQLSDASTILTTDSVSAEQLAPYASAGVSIIRAR
jgi:DeoR/GlpR family transcriptional regulator of sugar metabolism